MSFLREIQNDAASTDTDVANLLRKCKILAARLGSRGFSAWVDMELNGYPFEQPAPKYRRLVTGWFAQFISSSWRVERAAIPDFIVPEEARDAFHWTEVGDGVAAIQQFALDDGGVAQINHPELILAVQGKMFPGMSCASVWAQIFSNEFAQLLSAIRSRILDFVLELEAENPEAGEALPKSQPIPDDKLQPLVNNFFGSVGNLAQGSHGFSQKATVGIQRGD